MGLVLLMTLRRQLGQAHDYRAKAAQLQWRE
jgi:hypothetical protein